MNKVITTVLAIFLLVGTFSFVLAAEEEDSTVNTGVLGRLRLAFTFNQEKKVQLALEMSEAILEEAEELMAEDPEKAQSLMQQAQKFSEKANKTFQKMESNGSGLNSTEMEQIRQRLESSGAMANGTLNREREMSGNMTGNMTRDMEQIQDRINASGNMSDPEMRPEDAGNAPMESGSAQGKLEE